MLRFFEYLFKKCSDLDRFFRKEHIKGFNGAALIFFGIIAFGIIGEIFKEHFGNEILIKFTAFLLGGYIYIILPYAVFKNGNIKKYILFGERNTFQEIFHQFSNMSYLIFLGYFGYVAIFPVMGIPFLLKLYGVEFIINFLTTNLLEVIYIFVITGSFLWFAYHIVSKTVDIQKIKIKVALFTAVGTTFTTVIKGKEFEQFIFLMSCILLSFLWIQYLIELKIDE